MRKMARESMGFFFFGVGQRGCERSFTKQG